MNKPFDLADRSAEFAKQCRIFVKNIHESRGVDEDAKQLIRSSGSIGANYTEARDGLSKKDSLKCLRIARKEARESKQWLNIFEVHISSAAQQSLRIDLMKESHELLCILTTMIKKLED